MTIKSKITTGVIPILLTDTIILEVTGRVGIEAMNCFNSAAEDVVMTFFISPDLTSGSGQKVSTNTLSSGEEVDINAIVAQGYIEGQNIIAVASVAGVNCSASYTQFTGDDV